MLLKRINIRDKEVDNFIRTFQKEFLLKFGSVPIVRYVEPNTIKEPRSLLELESIANQCLNLKQFPDGVKTKRRKRNLVLTRFCTFVVAGSWGYTLEAIGEFFGYDHSTVLHGQRTASNLIDSRHIETIQIMTLLNDKLKKLEEDDGNVQPDPKEGTDP